MNTIVEQSHEQPLPSQKPIVLYVDDEADNLAVFKSSFRKYYTILTATSAAEAAQILGEQPVQIIITDQRMPDVTGVEFLKQTLHEQPEAIRIVLSGFSDADAVVKAINEANVYRFLQKPWSDTEIKTIIDAAVELYHVRHQNKEMLITLQKNNYLLDTLVSIRTNELEQVNQLLVQSNQELERINIEKSELMGVVAHDLKNPLAGVISLAEMIRDESFGLSIEEVRPFAARIVESGDRMLMLIQRVLETNAAEIGNLSVQLVSLNAAALVQTVMSEYQMRAQSKNIRLVFASTDEAVSTDPTMALADEVLFRQAIDNVLSNAVKYSPPHTTVTITVSVDASSVAVSVRDEGPGLTDDDKAQLFTKFARLSAKPTGGETSTGLGLAITKRIMEAMNGSVSCISDYGHGATFVLRVPRTR